MTRKLYKVTGPGGASGHGGSLQWSLPTADGPGEWHEVDGPLELCRRGLHLTWDPVRWYAAGYEVYEVEADGLGEEAAADRKIVCRRA